jgi:hypothetical protein
MLGELNQIYEEKTKWTSNLKLAVDDESKI